MRISAKARYGCLALIDIAQSEADGFRRRVREIADAQAIPARYLPQILIRLKAAGFVRSARGPDGGWLPARTEPLEHRPRRRDRGDRWPSQAHTRGKFSRCTQPRDYNCTHSISRATDAPRRHNRPACPATWAGRLGCLARNRISAAKLTEIVGNRAWQGRQIVDITPEVRSTLVSQIISVFRSGRRQIAASGL
jgi:hypothetical protein